LDIAGQSDKLMDLFCRPVAFQRMDNAIWASAYASQGKAVASAAFGRPSALGTVIPKGAKNVAAAKDFMKYVAQPKVLNEYLKGGLGRLLGAGARNGQKRPVLAQRGSTPQGLRRVEPPAAD